MQKCKEHAVEFVEIFGKGNKGAMWFCESKGACQMAIKQRALMKLNTIKHHVLRVMSTGSNAALDEVCRDLVETRDLYREGLSQKDYAPYGEIFDGLILAVRKMTEDGATNIQGDALVLCQELLEHLAKETAKETRFKKEIVFLPYKASMFDSLESVWKAAYEDTEHCNAYVIPIPYADRNPDGSVAEWHCERDKFPQYVPTLDWQSVDLKEMHPDVIFFHNPYDNFNRVTSVESRYYSRNLKLYTDKLVYIPYFVLGEPQLDYDDPKKAEEAEEKIAHFITTPGVLNADLTIVQSEAMKKVYVNVLNRHTNAPKGYWEEHILGLGSPKFDKVAESKKEDFELPDEWEKVVAGRKVILYNTGLSAMLELTDKFVKKIKSVLEIFKTQKEVALWWRPHPLLRPSIEAMHPELLTEYVELVEKYRQDGWGIYDDTADLDRAIACTDAYYGDWSSVVHLYEKTEKPVLVRNCIDGGSEMREFSPNAHFLDAVEYDGYMYFSETFFNGLFRIANNAEEAELIGRFPNEEPWQIDLHRSVFLHNHKLYFIPMNGKVISVYDLEKSIFSSLQISANNNKNSNFNQCLRVGDDILMIPANLATQFSYLHLESEKIEPIEGLSEKIASLIEQPTRCDVFNSHGAVLERDILYLAVSSTNVILKISLSTLEIVKYVLPVEMRIRYISMGRDSLWITFAEHVIGEWQEANNTCHILDIPKEPLNKEYPYLSVLQYENELIVLPGREDRFWQVSLITETWKNMNEEIPLSFTREIEGPVLFCGYRIIDDKYCKLFPRAGNGIITYDMKNKTFSFRSVRYMCKDLFAIHKEWVMWVWSCHSIFWESFMSIDDYLLGIFSHVYNEIDSRESENIGARIFENALAKKDYIL